MSRLILFFLCVVLSASFEAVQAHSRMALHYNSALACAHNNATQLLLSIIVTTTNTAPQDQIERLTLQLENIQYFTELYHLEFNVEYVVVEYNYDAKAPSLYEVLQKSFKDSLPLVRVVRVSAAQHELIVHKMGLDFEVNFLEFYAKNIGIRRSCGQFILPTNSDISFNDGFWSFLSRKTLRMDAYYRLPRCNVNGDLTVLRGLSVLERLVYLKDHTVDCWWCDRIEGTWKSYMETPVDVSAEPHVEQWRECIQAPGDFLLMSRASFERFRGYPDVALPHQLDDVPVWQAVGAGLFLIIVPKPAVALHVNHLKSYIAKDGRWHHAQEMVNTYKLHEAGQRMMREHNLEVFNGEDWGLAGALLEEDIY
jgi:hypothetical protein